MRERGLEVLDRFVVAAEPVLRLAYVREHLPLPMPVAELLQEPARPFELLEGWIVFADLGQGDAQRIRSERLSPAVSETGEDQLSRLVQRRRLLHTTCATERQSERIASRSLEIRYATVVFGASWCVCDGAAEAPLHGRQQLRQCSGDSLPTHPGHTAPGRLAADGLKRSSRRGA
jgi:hypothetical protein